MFVRCLDKYVVALHTGFSAGSLYVNAASRPRFDSTSPSLSRFRSRNKEEKEHSDFDFSLKTFELPFTILVPLSLITGDVSTPRWRLAMR